jgi:nitrogen fixation/metabolism regulation signal transduction histidine kinase
MQLRQQFRVSLAVLVGFQLITAFGAIGLLSRMTPAIAHILSENEYTIDAALQMLLLLSRRTFEPKDPEMERQFHAAVERARNNITEPGEPEVLARLEELSVAALQGDPQALSETVDSIRRLVEINRKAMREAEAEARRLGTAGAWAAVILAVAGLAASVIVSRRLARTLLDPVEELYEVTQAARSDDLFRRCRKSGATAEIRSILESVNLFLDQRTARQTAPADRDESARAVALHLLEQRSGPVFVLSRKGDVAMANTAGLDVLSGPDAAGWRQELSAVVSSGASGGRLRAAQVRDTELWLCSAA